MKPLKILIEIDTTDFSVIEAEQFFRSLAIGSDLPSRTIRVTNCICYMDDVQP